MTRRQACLATSVALSLILAFVTQVSAQDNRVEASKTEPSKVDASLQTAADIRTLSNEQLVLTRDTLVEDTQTLSNTIDSLNSVVSYVDELETANTPAEKQRLRTLISSYEQWAGLRSGEGTDKSKVTALWNEKQAEKTRLMQRRRAVDSEIRSRLAAQSFKAEVSLYGAAIVTIVVVGFFWTASRSEHVVTKIFGGQEGLQFITLFSLVVAIILFGVTGVLEGKELSALLGGLAGYILGRSGVSGQMPGQVPAAAPQDGAPMQPVAGVAAAPRATSRVTSEKGVDGDFGSNSLG